LQSWQILFFGKFVALCKRLNLKNPCEHIFEISYSSPEKSLSEILVAELNEIGLKDLKKEMLAESFY
jgi:hypothetical protein